MSADTIVLNAGPAGGGAGGGGGSLPSNPFVGLRPFDIDEGILFYGRGGQIKELLKRLHGTHFLAVVGSSGCGKSSLIRAGLIPKLKAGFIVGSRDRWRVATMKPGDSPLRNLAAKALEVAGARRADADAEGSFVKEMRVSGAEALLARVAPALERDRANLLLVVDQFEELFRYGDGAAGDTPEADEADEAADEEAAAAERERRREKAVERLRQHDEAVRFVSLILDLARQRAVPVYVVLTMRSDFLGDCDAYPRLPEEINESIFLVPRLDREQRKEAVAGPVKLYGRSITQRLLNRVVDDAGDESDQLPVMQHALMRTWDEWKKEQDEWRKKQDEWKKKQEAREEQGEGDEGEGPGEEPEDRLEEKPDERLDLRHYERAGTLLGALSKDADEALEKMTPRDRLIAERMFQALVETDAQGRRTRRPVHVSEIAAVVEAKPEATREEAFEVVKHFRSGGRCFLTTSSERDEGDPAFDISEDDPLVDISHESLIRQWGTLRKWVRAESKSREQYTLTAAAALRHEAGAGGLLTDPELSAASRWWAERDPNEAWARRYNPAFQLARAFLTKSEKRSKAARDEEDRRRLESLENENIRRQNARLRRYTYGLVMLLLFAVASAGLAAYAFAQSRRNEAEARKSEAQAQTEKQRAENQKAAAEGYRIDAETQRDAAETARNQAEDEKTRANEQARIAQERAAEAEKARNDLKAANDGRLKAVEQERKKTLGQVGLLYLDAAQAVRDRDAEKARETYERILALYEKENVPKGQLSALVLLGNFYRDRDEKKNALEYYSRAEKLSGTKIESGSTVPVLISHGELFASSEKDEERRRAFPLYESALKLLDRKMADSYERSDDRDMEASLSAKRALLIKTGTLHARLGERAAADEMYRQAVASDTTAYEVLVDIGMSYDQPAEAPEREKYFGKALEIGKALGVLGVAKVQYYIGHKLIAAESKFEDGLKHLNEAESFLRSEISTNPSYGSNRFFAYGVDYHLAHTRYTVGDAYAARGMKPEACAAYADASKLFKTFDANSARSVEELSRRLRCPPPPQ